MDLVAFKLDDAERQSWPGGALERMKDEGGRMKKEFVFIHPSSLILHPSSLLFGRSGPTSCRTAASAETGQFVKSKKPGS
jgi:hypothetical protein